MSIQPTGHPLESISLEVAISLDDSNDIAEAPCRAFTVNVSGNLKYTLFGGSTLTKFVSAGTVYPMYVMRFWNNGTSASGIHAGY